LQDFYQACDYVISLSTFYGEDYGLSLIEGLSQGLNCIATNWGGHRDLKPLPQVQLIDVHALDGKLALDEEQLERSFRMLAAPDRKQNLEYFKKLKALDQSALLQDIYQQMVPYGGLSKAAFIFHQRDNEAWRNKEIFEIHEKILRPYWE